MTPTIRSVTIVFACLATNVALIGQTQPAGQSTEGASVEIKALLDRFAGTDLPSRSERESRDQLIAKGTTAVPALEQLFKDSTDDQYRMTIVSVLFAIKGAERDAVRIVVESLSKDPAAWHGNNWVFVALLRLREVDPDNARWAALRVLESRNRNIDAALAHLEKIGKPQDIEPLKEFLATRKQHPAPDGLGISAENAIDAITKRQKANPGSKMVGEGKRPAEATPGAKSNPVQARAETPADGNPSGFSGGNWSWAIGGLLVAILLALWIASRWR